MADKLDYLDSDNDDEFEGQFAGADDLDAMDLGLDDWDDDNSPKKGGGGSGLLPLDLGLDDDNNKSPSTSSGGGGGGGGGMFSGLISQVKQIEVTTEEEPKPTIDEVTPIPGMFPENSSSGGPGAGMTSKFGDKLDKLNKTTAASSSSPSPATTTPSRHEIDPNLLPPAQREEYLKALRIKEDDERKKKEVAAKVVLLQREQFFSPLQLLHESFFSWMDHSRNILHSICRIIDECKQEDFSSAGSGEISEGGGAGDETRSTRSFAGSTNSSNKRTPHHAFQNIIGAGDTNANWFEKLPHSIDEFSFPLDVSSSKLAEHGEKLHKLRFASREPGEDAIRRMERVEFGNVEFSEEQQRPWNPAVELLLEPYDEDHRAIRLQEIPDWFKETLPTPAPAAIPGELGSLSDSAKMYEFELLAHFTGLDPDADSESQTYSMIERISVRAIMCIIVSHLLRKNMIDDEDENSVLSSSLNFNSTTNIGGSSAASGGGGGGGTLNLGRGGHLNLGGTVTGLNSTTTGGGGGGNSATATLKELQQLGLTREQPLKVLQETLGNIVAQATRWIRSAVKSTEEIPVTFDLTGIESNKVPSIDKPIKRSKMPVISSLAAYSRAILKTHEQRRSKLLPKFENECVVLDARLLEPLIRGAVAESMSAATLESLNLLEVLDQKKLEAEWIAWTVFYRSERFHPDTIRHATMSMNVHMEELIGVDRPGEDSEEAQRRREEREKKKKEGGGGGGDNDDEIQEHEKPITERSWLRPIVTLMYATIERCKSHIQVHERRKRSRSKAEAASSGGTSSSSSSNTAAAHAAVATASALEQQLGGTINFVNSISIGATTTAGGGGGGGGTTTLDGTMKPNATSNSNNNSSSGSNQQQQGSGDTNYDEAPPGRENIEFIMDLLLHCLQLDGTESFLRCAPSLSSALPGSTTGTFRFGAAASSGGPSSSSPPSTLKVMKGLVVMIAKFHRFYCGAHSHHNSLSNSQNPSQNASPSRDNLDSTTTGGLNATTNSGSAEQHQQQQHHHQQKEAEPCKCHILVARVLNFINPLTLIKTVSHNSPVTQEKNEAAAIEKLLAPTDIGTILETVHDSLAYFALTLFGPDLWNLRCISQLSAPSEKWCFENLNVNPYAPASVIATIINYLEQIILQSVQIITVSLKLPALKDPNPARRAGTLRVILHSKAMRVLGMCFSMTFSALEPYLFKQRIHYHDVMDSDQRNSAAAVAASAAKATPQHDLGTGFTRRRSMSASVLAAVTGGGGGGGLEGSGNLAQSESTVLGGLGSRHDSIRISARPMSARSNVSSEGAGGASIEDTAAAAADAAGIADVGGAVSEELPLLKHESFSALNKAVKVISFMMYPFDVFKGLRDPNQVQQVDNESDINLNKSPEEALALYVLSDLAGIPPEALEIPSLATLAASSPGGSNSPSRDSSPSASSSPSPSSASGPTPITRRARGQSFAAARAEEAVTSSTVYEGQGVGTCGAILAFLRFQATCGLAKYHYESLVAALGGEHSANPNNNSTSSNPLNASASARRESVPDLHANSSNLAETTETGVDPKVIAQLKRRVDWLIVVVNRLASAGNEVKLRLVQAGLLESLCVCADPMSAVVIEHPKKGCPWIGEAGGGGGGAGGGSFSLLQNLLVTYPRMNLVLSTLDDTIRLAEFQANSREQLLTATLQEYLRAHAMIGSGLGFYNTSTDNAQPALKMIANYLMSAGVVGGASSSSSHHHHHHHSHSHHHHHHGGGDNKSSSSSSSASSSHHNQSFRSRRAGGGGGGGAGGSGSGGGGNDPSGGGGSPLKASSVASYDKFAYFESGVSAPVIYILILTQKLQQSFKYYFHKNNLSDGGWLAEASSGTLSACERNVAILVSVLASTLRRTATAGKTTISRRVGVVLCVRDLARKLTKLSDYHTRRAAGEKSRVDESDDDDDLFLSDRDDDDDSSSNSSDSSDSDDDNSSDDGNNEEGENDGNNSTTTSSSKKSRDRKKKKEKEKKKKNKRKKRRHNRHHHRRDDNNSRYYSDDDSDEEAILYRAAVKRRDIEKKIQKGLRRQGISSPSGFALDTVAAGALLSSLAAHAISAVKSIDQAIEHEKKKNEPAALGRRRSSLGKLGALTLNVLQSNTTQYSYAYSTFIAIASILQLPFQSLVLLRAAPAAVKVDRLPLFFPVWFKSPNTWCCRFAIEEEEMLGAAKALASILKAPCESTLRGEKPSSSSSSFQQQQHSAAVPNLAIRRDSESPQQDMEMVTSTSTSAGAEPVLEAKTSFKEGFKAFADSSNPNSPTNVESASPAAQKPQQDEGGGGGGGKNLEGARPEKLDVDSLNNTQSGTASSSNFLGAPQQEKHVTLASPNTGVFSAPGSNKVSSAGMSFARKKSLWSLAREGSSQMVHEKEEKDSHMSPEVQAKIAQSQLWAQQSAGLLLCVCSKMIEIPHGAKKLATRGANMESERLKISQNQACMFAVQQAASYHRAEMQMIKDQSSLSAPASPSAAAAAGTGNNTAAQTMLADITEHHNTHDHYHSSQIANRSTSFITPQRGGSNSSQQQQLISSLQQKRRVEYILSPEESELCHEQYKVLLEINMKQAAEEERTKEAEHKAGVGIDPHGGKNEKEKQGPTNSETLLFFEQVVLKSNKEACFANEKTGREAIENLEQGQWMSMMMGSPNPFPQPRNSFGVLLPASSLSTVQDTEESMRNAICVSEQASFLGLEGREGRIRDRLFLHEALADLPTQLKKISEQNDIFAPLMNMGAARGAAGEGEGGSGGGFNSSPTTTTTNITAAPGRGQGGRPTIVFSTAADDDAEYKRVVNLNRQVSREVTLLKEQKSSLFEMWRRDVEKTETNSRERILDEQISVYTQTLERSFRRECEDIEARASLVKYAALEFTESASRDQINRARKQDMETLSLLSKQQLEQTRDKPVFVQYSWGPSSMHHHNYNHTFASGSGGGRIVPTPPPGSLLLHSSRPNSRPSSAVARARRQLAEEQKNKFAGGTLEDTLCASAMTRAMKPSSTSSPTAAASSSPNNNEQQKKNNNKSPTRPVTAPHVSTASSSSSHHDSSSVEAGLQSLLVRDDDDDEEDDTMNMKPSEMSLSLDLAGIADLISGQTSRSLLDPDLAKSLRVLPLGFVSNSKTLVVPSNEQIKKHKQLQEQELQQHQQQKKREEAFVLASPPRTFLVLDMSKHFLGDVGVANLVDSLQQNGSISQLVAINISNNGLTDNGVATLLRALRAGSNATSLFELNFEGNKKISSKSGKLFAKFVEETPSLHRLNLKGTGIFRATLFIIQEMLAKRVSTIQSVIYQQEQLKKNQQLALEKTGAEEEQQADNYDEDASTVAAIEEVEK